MSKDILGGDMPKVNPFEYPIVECPECSCKDFVPCMRFYEIPGLLVGSKENVYYPYKVFICKKCGELSPMSQKEIDEIMSRTLNNSKVEKPSGLSQDLII